MPALKPTKHKAFVTEGWGFAPAVEDFEEPTLTELTAASGLVLTFFVLADQEDVATSNTERVTLPRVLGERVQYEALGPTTYSGGTLRCLWDPQAASGETDKKAWETLVEADTGVLWNRQNVAADTDLAVSQFVDLYPSELGPRTPRKTSTGTDAVWVFDCPVGIIGAPAFNKAVVTGA